MCPFIDQVLFLELILLQCGAVWPQQGCLGNGSPHGRQTDQLWCWSHARVHICGWGTQWGITSVQHWEVWPTPEPVDSLSAHEWATHRWVGKWLKQGLLFWCREVDLSDCMARNNHFIKSIFSQGLAQRLWTTTSMWWGVTRGHPTWTLSSGTTPSQTAGWTLVAWCTAAVTLGWLLFDPWYPWVGLLKRRVGRKAFLFFFPPPFISGRLRAVPHCRESRRASLLLDECARLATGDHRDGQSEKGLVWVEEGAGQITMDLVTEMTTTAAGPQRGLCHFTEGCGRKLSLKNKSVDFCLPLFLLNTPDSFSSSCYEQNMCSNFLDP